MLYVSWGSRAVVHEKIFMDLKNIYIRWLSTVFWAFCNFSFNSDCSNQNSGFAELLGNHDKHMFKTGFGTFEMMRIEPLHCPTDLKSCCAIPEVPGPNNFDLLVWECTACL